MRILYDGWPLSYQPNSPAALHLLSLLAHHPANFKALVALPAKPALLLPESVTAHIQATGAGDNSRLSWEQRILPRLATLLKADLVHLSASYPALLGKTNQLISPTSSDTLSMSSFGFAARPSLAARLRDALGQGGLTRVSGVLWPDDLPTPGVPHNIFRLPRVTHPDLLSPSIFDMSSGERPHLAEFSELEMPETYILYHGPLSTLALRRLLGAWSWAAGSIGEYYPLLVAGVEASLHQKITAMLTEFNLTDSVQLVPPLNLPSLFELYRGCSALFLPVPDSPWQGAIPLALTCGKPIVALETPESGALVGPAGYLLPDSNNMPDNRALGAALITVVVEESVAEQLSQNANQRATQWESHEQVQRFTHELASAYTLLGAQQTRRQ